MERYIFDSNNKPYHNISLCVHTTEPKLPNLSLSKLEFDSRDQVLFILHCSAWSKLKVRLRTKDEH